MKLFFTVIIYFLFFLSTSTQAQSLARERANRLTREMTAAIPLNEGELILLKKINQERFAQIDALSKMRNLSRREIEIRLDQIEEDYNAKIFHAFNSRQYAAYKKFQEKNPGYYNLSYRSLYLAAGTPRNK